MVYYVCIFTMFYVLSAVFCWHQIRKAIQRGVNPHGELVLMTLFPVINTVIGIAFYFDGKVQGFTGWFFRLTVDEKEEKEK